MEKNINESGYFNQYDKTYEINLSSIYSKLIKECGRLVEDYNSDLLYDINGIEEFFMNVVEEGGEEVNKVFWIGLREYGVDGKEFIKCRCKNPYYYRKLFRIELVKNTRKCSATLKEVDISEFIRENSNEIELH